MEPLTQARRCLSGELKEPLANGVYKRLHIGSAGALSETVPEAVAVPREVSLAALLTASVSPNLSKALSRLLC